MPLIAHKDLLTSGVSKKQGYGNDKKVSDFVTLPTANLVHSGENFIFSPCEPTRQAGKTDNRVGRHGKQWIVFVILFQSNVRVYYD